MTALPEAARFVPLPTISRLVLALAVGLFVGLEREHRGKEAGLRTFGFSALLGCLGGLVGEAFSLLSLGFLGVLIAFLNWQSLRAEQGTELTTSAALLVTGFAGVLCGLGHTFTPVAVGVLTAALLAWKGPLAGFSLGLTEQELRSAILLGIIAFVIYPILPPHPVDRWGLIDPQPAWFTVILIAAVGLASYVLLKMYGATGFAWTGFLGGLVNSSVTVAELARRVRETHGRLAPIAYRGMLLATAAMVARNAVILGLLEPAILLGCAAPLALMLLTSLLLALPRGADDVVLDGKPLEQLESPFSLMTALRYGAVFLALQVSGTLAQRALGTAGFLVVSAAGGLVSSASAVAAAAVLAADGHVATTTAGTAAVIATLTSAAVNLPLVSRASGEPRLTRRVALALAIILAIGTIGAVVQVHYSPQIAARLGGASPRQEPYLRPPA